jgi:hypothetical protein
VNHFPSILVRAAAAAALLLPAACYPHPRHPHEVYVAENQPPVQEVIIVEAPPPPRVEVIPAPPSPNHVWQAGYWERRGNAWVWVEGHHVVRPHARAVWVAGHWDHRLGGYVWIPGHWA